MRVMGEQSGQAVTFLTKLTTFLLLAGRHQAAQSSTIWRRFSGHVLAAVGAGAWHSAVTCILDPAVRASG